MYLCMLLIRLNICSEYGKEPQHHDFSLRQQRKTLFIRRESRLKVRYKRFSIRQLIWIHMKKNTDYEALTLVPFFPARAVPPLLFPCRLPVWTQTSWIHVCMDFCHFFAEKHTHTHFTQLWNRYGLPYKSVWFLFFFYFLASLTPPSVVWCASFSVGDAGILHFIHVQTAAYSILQQFRLCVWMFV